MKIGAGIAGILLGILSLLYVGIFGGMLGVVVGATNPLHDSNVAAWASMVSLLSWLAPLLAIAGGIVTFSKPRVGGIVLAASACLLLYLLGFGFVGKVFGLPIGAAAILAFFAAPSPFAFENSSQATTSSSGTSDLFSNSATAGFDRNKWNALIQYDNDVALVAERIRPLGSRWMNEFASSYLALSDKQYLPSIEVKIAAAAKAESEENERQRKSEQEERAVERAYYEAKRQEDSELWRARTRAAKERIWGSRAAKIRTIATSGATFILIASITGGIFAWRDAEQSKAARTELFFEAVNHGNVLQARELLQKGVNTKAKDRDGQTPLFKVLNDQDSVMSLIEHGADVNASANDGMTPLHLAGNPAVVSILLSHGAAVNAKNNAGLMPLYGCSSPEKLKLLIDNHADVNLQINSGETPLHSAASCGSLPNVKALVENGAQVNVKNQHGKSPLDLSIGHPEITAYLQAHGAVGETPIQLGTLSTQRRNPAYDAALLSLFSNRSEVPSWLLQSGFGGVEHNGRVIIVDGKRYELFPICKPHDCGGNFLYAVFPPGGGRAWALTTEDDRNLRFYGNPDQGLQAFLMNQYRRNQRGEWP